MAEIHLGAIRRSRFISHKIFEEPSDINSVSTWRPQPGYTELVGKFIRNKVLFEFNTSGLDVRAQANYNKDIEHIVEAIHEFCDNNCTALWSMDYTYIRDSDFNFVTMISTAKDTGSGKMHIYFENEADIEPFLKNCAVLLKLAN